MAMSRTLLDRIFVGAISSTLPPSDMTAGCRQYLPSADFVTDMVIPVVNIQSLSVILHIFITMLLVVCYHCARTGSMQLVYVSLVRKLPAVSPLLSPLSGLSPVQVSML